MALLTHSSPVGTSTSAFESNSSTSISTTSTTTTTSTTKPTNTTATQSATTKTIATSTNKSQPPSTSTTTATRSATTLLGHLRPLLSTTLKTLYQTHRLLFSLLFSTTTLLLLQGFSLLSSVLQLLALSTSFATKLILYRSLLFTRTAIMETASLTWNIWDSRKARQIRKKIEFEFFVWILGPGGNLLCFLLWPGWLVLGFMIWALSFAMTGLTTSAGAMPVSG